MSAKIDDQDAGYRNILPSKRRLNYDDENEDQNIMIIEQEMVSEPQKRQKSDKNDEHCATTPSETS